MVHATMLYSILGRVIGPPDSELAFLPLDIARCRRKNKIELCPRVWKLGDCDTYQWLRFRFPRQEMCPEHCTYRICFNLQYFVFPRTAS